MNIEKGSRDEEPKSIPMPDWMRAQDAARNRALKEASETELAKKREILKQEMEESITRELGPEALNEIAELAKTIEDVIKKQLTESQNPKEDMKNWKDIFITLNNELSGLPKKTMKVNEFLKTASRIVRGADKKNK